MHLLWVCRQTREEVLSTIASSVPLDSRTAGPKRLLSCTVPNFWENFIRKQLPRWYASKLRKVYCWRESNAAQACLAPFPCLNTLILSGRDHISLKSILVELNLKRDESDIKWTCQDVETPEVMEAVRVKSLKVLTAELADIRLHCPERRLEVVLELGFGTFDVNVRKLIAPPQQRKAHSVAGHTFVRLPTCSNGTKLTFPGRPDIACFLGMPQG